MKHNLAFSISILGVSVFAFYFPSPFVQIGLFDTRGLIIPLLMLIMFGMGTQLSLTSLIGVWQTPKSLMVGLGCQFSVMPIIGFALAWTSDLPPEIAAGIILVGCSPSGLASNVMCYISKANLALSLTLTTLATLLAPLLTPMLMSLLANQFVAIDSSKMFITMLQLIVLPVSLGLLFNHFLASKMTWVNQLMPTVSMAGIIIIVSIIIAHGQSALANIGLVIVFIVIAHNLSGFVFGYFGGKLSGLPEQDCRSLSFEVGMQNSGLATGIALSMGKLTTMGLAPAIFSSLQNILGSLLASIWRNKNVAKAGSIND